MALKPRAYIWTQPVWKQSTWEKGGPDRLGRLRVWHILRLLSAFNMQISIVRKLGSWVNITQSIACSHCSTVPHLKINTVPLPLENGGRGVLAGNVLKWAVQSSFLVSWPNCSSTSGPFLMKLPEETCSISRHTKSLLRTPVFSHPTSN